MPMMSAYKVRMGSAITSPMMRGSTSTSTVLSPMVCIASISSLTRMVPIWAVKADPERHAHAQKIDGEDFRAEALELVGALIGQHHPDQEGQQPHDRQRADSGFLNLMD